MTDLMLIIISLALANNLLLDHLIGLDPAIAMARRLEVAFGMAATVLFVFPMTTASCYLIYHYLLVPLQVEYLYLVVFMAVNYSLLLATEIWLQTNQVKRIEQLGVFLPLLMTNCALLGVVLVMLEQAHSFWQALAIGFGAALGFGLALLIFSSLHGRLHAENIPAPFQGAPALLITLALLSLGFYGLGGIIRG